MKIFKNHVNAGLHLSVSPSFGYKTESKPNREQDVWTCLSSKGTT